MNNFNHILLKQAIPPKNFRPGSYTPGVSLNAQGVGVVYYYK